jgi:MinD-like ATPase involved in chromosome partitioning or flagellar assembly
MIFGFDTQRLTNTLTDFIFGKCEVEEAAYNLSNALEIEGGGALYLLPSSMKVDDISRIIAEGYDVTRMSDELKKLMSSLELDCLLLDTHPGLNRETMLSTSISDVLLILIRPDTQDFHGTAVLLKVARALSVPRTFMLANKVAQSLPPDEIKSQVEQAFESEVLGLLPLSEEMATLGSRELFVRKYPSHEISRELHAVAERLLAELDL